MRREDLYDVYVEGYTYPVAINLSEADAENVDLAYRVLQNIDDRIALNTRSNPDDSDISESLHNIENDIRNLIRRDEIPSDKKQLFSLVEGRAKGELSKLHDKRREIQIEILSINLALSTVDKIDGEFSILVNSGVVAKIISSCHQRFSNLLDICTTIEFDNLDASQKTFITNILNACDAFFDITITNNITAFKVTDFCETLVQFQTAPILDKALEIIATSTFTEKIGPHYAPPFFRAILIGTMVDPQIANWLSAGEYNTLYGIFKGTSSQHLNQANVAELVKIAQTRTITPQGLALARSILLSKNDSESQRESPILEAILVKAELISKGNLPSSVPMLVALTAFAISSSTEYSEIIKGNMGANRSAATILKALSQFFKVSHAMTPVDAYEYANVSNAEGKTYITWAFPLIVDYIFSNNHNRTAYQDALHTSRMIREDPEILEEISNFAKELRLKNFVISNVSPLDLSFNHSFSRQDVNTYGLDFNDLVDSSCSIAYIDEIKKISERAFNALFPRNIFSFQNPLHCIFDASMRISDRDFNRPSAKTLAFRKLNIPSQYDGFEVFASTRYNPLTLCGGNPRFWNCCFSAFREARSTALASFLTTQTGYLGSFGFGVPNKASDMDNAGDTFCLTFKEYTQVEFANPEDIDPPSESTVEIKYGVQGIDLYLESPHISKLSESLPDVQGLSIYAIGGNERAQNTYEIPDSYIDKSAEALLSAVKLDVIFGNYTLTANNADYFARADAVVNLTVNSLDTGRSIPEAKVSPVNEAYHEAGEEGDPFTLLALGFAIVSEASQYFNHITIDFDNEGDNALITYDFHGDVQFTVSWDVLQYMFALPTANKFIPFNGTVQFNTSAANKKVCIELLTPTWLSSADRKPLLLGSKLYNSTQLKKLRTPKNGAYLGSQKIL